VIFWLKNGLTMVNNGMIWDLASGNDLHSYWKWPFSSLIYLWQLGIFQFATLVCLPEGNSWINYVGGFFNQEKIWENTSERHMGKW
jgi:hypothetical protein